MFYFKTCNSVFTCKYAQILSMLLGPKQMSPSAYLFFKKISDQFPSALIRISLFINFFNFLVFSKINNNFVTRFEDLKVSVNSALVFESILLYVSDVIVKNVK